MGIDLNTFQARNYSDEHKKEWYEKTEMYLKGKLTGSEDCIQYLIRKAEENLSEWGHWRGDNIKSYSNDVISVTRAGKELANDLNVTAIVVFTQTGRTARLMSKTHPSVHIIGCTPNKRTYSKMSFFRGVVPIIVAQVNSIEEMLGQVQKELSSVDHIKPGQQIVMIAGYPVGEINLPNFAMLYKFK